MKQSEIKEIQVISVKRGKSRLILVLPLTG